MRPNSPSAVLVSLTLHVFVGAIIFATTIFVARQEQAPPVVFELVAGPPTAPDELVAPALGSTVDPVKVDLPKPPEKSEPQVQEITKAPEPEVREAVVPPKPVPVKAKAAASIAKELKKSEKVSYRDYLKKHPIPKTPPKTAAVTPTGAKVPRIDAPGIANGVRGGSVANTRGGGGGKALTREEADAMQVYEAALRNRLAEAFQSTKPAGLSDTLVAEVEFIVAASGGISAIRISRSSGNQDFDQSALEAFRHITWPGARPDHKSDLWRLSFRMKEE